MLVFLLSVHHFLHHFLFGIWKAHPETMLSKVVTHVAWQVKRRSTGPVSICCMLQLNPTLPCQNWGVRKMWPTLLVTAEERQTSNSMQKQYKSNKQQWMSVLSNESTGIRAKKHENKANIQCHRHTSGRFSTAKLCTRPAKCTLQKEGDLDRFSQTWCRVRSSKSC